LKKRKKMKKKIKIKIFMGLLIKLSKILKINMNIHPKFIIANKFIQNTFKIIII
jgi:hypothetical protein